MKILLVHNYYKYSGGEDSVFKNEVTALERAGHEVTTYTRNNLELNDFSLFKRMLVPFIYCFNLRTYIDVKKIIERKHIDIVHVHNTLSLVSFSVYYAAFHKRVPVIQTIHNFRFICPNALLFRNGCFCEKCIVENSYRASIENGCYHNSRIHTFFLVAALLLHKNTRAFKNLNYIFLTDLSAKKFRNFVDLNSNNVYIKGNFVASLYTDRKNVDFNRFVYVGRLESGKGILEILEFWKCVNPNFTLTIYGDGPLKDKIESISENSSNIFYEGKKSNDLILSELSFSTAMIFPSKYFENFPMTVIESFSVGCPVIAYAFGNGAELVSKSKGGIIYNDYSSFSQAIQIVIQKNSFFSNNAIKFYLDTSTEERSLIELNHIYLDLIKNNHF